MVSEDARRFVLAFARHYRTVLGYPPSDEAEQFSVGFGKPSERDESGVPLNDYLRRIDPVVFRGA